MAQNILQLSLEIYDVTC